MVKTDPLTALLDADGRRASTATELARAHDALTQAQAAYRHAWKAATSAGWARTDLVRAGFTDTSRLPREHRSRTGEHASASPSEE